MGGEGDNGLSEALSDYTFALTIGPNQGAFTQITAATILKLGRAAGRTPKQLAEDLGHPIGTIKTWLNRLNLTELGRLARTPKQMAQLKIDEIKAAQNEATKAC